METTINSVHDGVTDLLHSEVSMSDYCMCGLKES